MAIAQPPEEVAVMFVRIIMWASFFTIEVMEMDLSAITTLIGSLGFPIAACIACFWMLNKERDDHKAEMQKVTEAINNNTLAVTMLTERLSKDG